MVRPRAGALVGPGEQSYAGPPGRVGETRVRGSGSAGVGRRELRRLRVATSRMPLRAP